MTSCINRLVRVLSVVGLIAALGLLFGCAKATPATTGASTSQSSAGDTAAAGPMTIKLLEPTAGAEVPAGTVTAKVETSGIKFVMPNNKPVAGEGHVHFTLDDRPEIMSAEPQVDIEDVAPGKHTLKAELVQNDAQPFSPAIEEVIEITAK